MEMPFVLKQAAERLVSAGNAAKNNARAISRRYRDERAADRTIVDADEAAAYAVARMPATFGAIAFVLQQLKGTGLAPETLTDAGAGTGAAVWAAQSLFNLKSALCLEREPAMRRVGEKLTAAGGDFFTTSPEWHGFDLTADAVEPADLVTACYVLNELPDGARATALLKLWAAARQALVVVEPATPTCFDRMKVFRTALIENGAFIAAPCPHQNACPESWCHFARRVQRSKLHRVLKNGDAPFEDEKFTYLIATRERVAAAAARILRRPKIEKNKVVLTLCETGGVCERTVFKNGADYKAARKSDWGDAFISNP